MSIHIDVLVGKTLLSFSDANRMTIDEHAQAFKRVAETMQRQIQNRIEISEQNKKFNITEVI